MTKGILLVQSRPSSPEEAAEFHQWYDEVHVPEMLAVEGVVSARRLVALDGESFLAIYEIEGDVEQAKANLATAQASGSMSKPVAVRLDPPPSAQYFLDLARPS